MASLSNCPKSTNPLADEPPSPLVLHVPHASGLIPDPDRADMDHHDRLNRDVLELTDWYTDEIVGTYEANATVVRFPFSRFMIDPERYENDEEEPMAANGMGVVYTRLSDGTRYRPSLTVEQRERLIEDHYRPHHQALESAVTRALSSFGQALILDVDSFPGHPTPIHQEQYGSRSQPDICIGTTEVHTSASLVDLVRRHAENAGFSVELNRPFAGTIVPSAYFGDARVQSVMIEFNKRLYLHEGTNKKNEGFGLLRAWGIGLVNKLIVYVVQQEHLEESFMSEPHIDGAVS